MTEAIELANRLEAATNPAELENLGWEAARVLLGVETVDEARLRLTVNMRLIGNPARSSDACKRLHETVGLGWVRLTLNPHGNSGVMLSMAIGGAHGRAPTIEAAWLAAMLRAKGELL
jgi:hypothetical protein